MVKQTKTFKKGNVTKKALSAILAASMVMTSSSFVMAAPVDVVVETEAVDTAAEEVAVGAEEAEAVEEAEVFEEENVGNTLSSITVTVTPGSKYNFGAEVRPDVSVSAKVNNSANITILPASEYSVAYSDNKEAGYGTVTVSFDQNVYQDQKPVVQTFLIDKFTLTGGNKGNTTIKLKDKPEGYVYNGEVQKPEIESIVVKNANVDHKYTAADCEVVAVTGSDMKSAGTQEYTIKMNNKNFTVGTNMTFSIPISACEFKAGNVSVSSKTAPAGITVDEAKKYVVIKNQKGEVLDNSNFDITFYDSTGKAVSSSPTKLYKGSYTAEVSVKDGKSGNYVGTAKLTTPFTVTGNVLEAAVEQAEIKVDTDYSTENNFGEPKKTADGYTIEYIGVEQHISKVTLPSSIDKSNYDIDEATVTKGTNAGDVLTATIIGKNALAGESAVVSVKIVPRVIKESDFCDIYKSTATPQGDDWFKYKAVLGEKLDGSVSDNAIVNIKFWDYSETGSDKYTKNLEEGKDYSYTVDKSSQTIVLTGKGNFTTVNPDTKTDTISLGYHTEDKVQLGDPNIVVTVNGTYKYTGKPVTPTDVTVVDKTTGTATTLVKGQDYDLSFGTNTDAGKGVIIIVPAAKNQNCRYAGSKAVKFDIVGEDIANVAVVKDLKDVALTATSKRQKPVVTFKNGNALIENTDYTVKYYKNGKEVTSDIDNSGAFASTGTITVEVNGKGRYTGKITKTYNITGYDITSATVEEIKDQVYTGSAIEPEVKVTGQVDKNGKLVGRGGIAKIFIKGVDYTVEYSNNVEAGTAHVLIKGIGKYSGEIAKTFKITGVMNQNIEVLAAQERDLGNGSRTLNSKPTKIKYTAKTDVTFESSNEDVVTVDAEGNIKYTGLGEATITIKAAAQNGYEAATKELKVVVKLAKPSFTPFSKNNAFTLTSSTVKGAEKFEVEYATKKDFSNKKSKTFTATSGKVRQVKVSAGDKTTYYVRVRAISGTTKSAWSNVKTVATK